MKYLLLFCGLLHFSAPNLYAQLDPVKWAFSYQKIDAFQYKITLEASLEEGWWIYGEKSGENKMEGPIYLTIDIALPDQVRILDTLDEAVPSLGYDNIFEEKLLRYQRQFRRSYIIGVTDVMESVVLKGEVEFMARNEGLALPPTVVCFKYKFNDLPVKSISVGGKGCVIATENKGG